MLLNNRPTTFWPRTPRISRIHLSIGDTVFGPFPKVAHSLHVKSIKDGILRKSYKKEPEIDWFPAHFCVYTDIVILCGPLPRWRMGGSLFGFLNHREHFEPMMWTAASIPREASEMFQCIKYEDKREVFGLKIHSFSTLDRIKKYDDSDNGKSAEKPYSIEVGEIERTINLYAIASTKFQVAV